tara:strand:- start:3007 stop:3243 length:237 start_codon:yes stop_codon:yes gene_type:complete
MAFHDAFERTVSRVIYKKDWGTARPAIMRHNNWPKCNSETLIRCDVPPVMPSAMLATHHPCVPFCTAPRVDSARHFRC